MAAFVATSLWVGLNIAQFALVKWGGVTGAGKDLWATLPALQPWLAEWTSEVLPWAGQSGAPFLSPLFLAGVLASVATFGLGASLPTLLARSSTPGTLALLAGSGTGLVASALGAFGDLETGLSAIVLYGGAALLLSAVHGGTSCLLAASGTNPHPTRMSSSGSMSRFLLWLDPHLSLPLLWPASYLLATVVLAAVLVPGEWGETVRFFASPPCGAGVSPVLCRCFLVLAASVLLFWGVHPAGRRAAMVLGRFRNVVFAPLQRRWQLDVAEKELAETKSIRMVIEERTPPLTPSEVSIPPEDAFSVIMPDDPLRLLRRYVRDNQVPVLTLTVPVSDVRGGDLRLLLFPEAPDRDPGEGGLPEGDEARCERWWTAQIARARYLAVEQDCQVIPNWPWPSRPDWRPRPRWLERVRQLGAVAAAGTGVTVPRERLFQHLPAVVESIRRQRSQFQAFEALAGERTGKTAGDLGDSLPAALALPFWRVGRCPNETVRVYAQVSLCEATLIWLASWGLGGLDLSGIRARMERMGLSCSRPAMGVWEAVVRAAADDGDPCLAPLLSRPVRCEAALRVLEGVGPSFPGKKTRATVGGLLGFWVALRNATCGHGSVPYNASGQVSLALWETLVGVLHNVVEAGPVLVDGQGGGLSGRVFPGEGSKLVATASGQSRDVSAMLVVQGGDLPELHMLSSLRESSASYQSYFSGAAVEVTTGQGERHVS